MTLELPVGAADVSEMSDLDSFVVTLAENPDGSGWHLMFAMPLSVSDQDIELGQGTYSISTSTGATCYGGVDSVERGDDVIAVRLSDAASKTIGLDRDIRLSFVEVHSASEIERGLRRVLAGPARHDSPTNV